MQRINTWPWHIRIFSLVAFEFILKKALTEGRRPPGYQRGNVFGCPCGDGIEGPHKIPHLDRRRREFEPDMLSNSTIK